MVHCYLYMQMQLASNIFVVSRSRYPRLGDAIVVEKWLVLGALIFAS